ncbi:uncharacterized protein LOC119616162 isoform X2 [Lucilia sericata]|uniref:uncharacterized protein LOC119616162 isoform X2 n=1 Tax=Lucilia sericata TaxID=13632 RepID=UPI0018A7F56F|nr:uncharacterized protein LOC119616162 isoform X2 [Lucilia sericata]
MGCKAGQQDAAKATHQTKINEVFDIDYSPKKVAEIKLALFIVEHNLPFAVSDHLTKVCQHSFKDSNTAANITLGRTKANAIIKNIVGAKQFSDVTNLLKTNSFSLCVDESTDLTNVKSLCLVVRLCLNFEIKDFFYGLLTVEHADANSLYQLIVNHFNKNGVNYKKNMIGFAADGAAVMTGRNKSVAQLLKNENNDLFIIKCVCHSLALCSSYACLKLPSSVEPLKIYFAFAVNIDKIDTAQYILDNLNFENKIYLCFLKYILGIINNINKMFQSETTEIQNLYDKMQKLLKTVLSNFIKLDLLKNDKFYLLNYKDEQNILDYNEVYLGVYAREELMASGLEETQKNKIIHNCINFYVELCDQILVRFDFGEKFQALSLINPYYIISNEKNTFYEIVNQFSHFIEENEKQDLESEFRQLKLIN